MARIWIVVICLVLAQSALACTYPTTLRSLNADLLEMFDSGDEVLPIQRYHMARALAELPDTRLELTLAGVISSRDLQAVTRIMQAARQVADGRISRLDPGLRSEALHLRDTADVVCAMRVDAPSEPGEATSVERGVPPAANGVSTQTTFREGVTRLSLIFTVYFTFLAFLFRMRRIWLSREQERQHGRRHIQLVLRNPDERGNNRA